VTDQLQLLALDQISPAKDNPRRNIGDVTELAASIKSVGLLEPLIATTNGSDGKLVLVAGARRLAAAKKAGLETVPVIVKTLSEAQRIEAMLIENIQREDLDPLEEAHAYKKLFDLGYTEHKLAERIGRSQSHISKRISLLKLPDVAKKALDAGKLQLADAYELTKLADHPERIKHAITLKQQNGYFRDMKQVVDQELEVQKQHDRAAAARAKLTAAGVKIVGAPKYDWQPPKGCSFVGNGWNEMNVDLEQHKKRSCSAAFIDATGNTRWVCTDPASHPKAKAAIGDGNGVIYPGGQSTAASMAKEREKRDREEKELEAAAEARTKVLRQALKGRANKAFAKFTLTQLIALAAWGDEGEITCQLLGIDGKRPEKALVEYAAKSSDHLQRAALAVAFAIGENGFLNRLGTDGLLERHLTVLKKLGYEPIAAERKLAK
jgi:ParB family chromosome partitioning protein